MQKFFNEQTAVSACPRAWRLMDVEEENKKEAKVITRTFIPLALPQSKRFA